MRVFSWVALVVGTFTAGAGLAFLGDRNRLHAAEHEFLARLTGMLKVEQGIAESLRMVLDELRRAFKCEKAILVFRDAEVERLFVWSGAWRASRDASLRRACRWRAPTASFWIARRLRSAGIRWRALDRLWLESARWPASGRLAARAGRGAAGARTALHAQRHL